MNNPYRIHSTICVNLIQLFMMASLTYPDPPPPLYHSIVISRLASTVYFGFYPESRTSLVAECTTIVLKIISDALYIRYIVTNYTFVFGILDIISDLIFVSMVLSSITSHEKIKILNGKIQHYIFTCCGLFEENEYMRNNTPKLPSFTNNKESNEQQAHAFQRYSRQYDETRGHYAYTSIPLSTNNTSPLTFPSPYMTKSQNSKPTSSETNVLNPFLGSGQYHTPSNTIKNNNSQRQPFKPNYYARSGIEHEEDYSFQNTESPPISVHNQQQQPIQPPVIHSSKNTMYVNFDEYDNGTNHYANICVTPFYDSNGNGITLFSSICNYRGVTPEMIFIIGNICHCIYQIMIYINITNTCKTYTILSQNVTTVSIMTRLLC